MKSVRRLFQIKSKEDKGFTLIETMIALFVFTFGILAVMTMTVTSMGSFTRSRTTSTEVNRTALNLETLKQVGYSNSDVFQGTAASPIGSDGTTVSYADTDNAVVFETKLIVMQNNKIKGSGAGNNYEVYYTKPLIE